MQGKSLFLDRAASRTHDWGQRFTALSLACRNAHSISHGRQVVVAMTDQHGVQCAFFTNLGAVFEFHATWAELARARTWWHFVRQWNFWLVDSADSIARIFPDGSGTDHTAIVLKPVASRPVPANLHGWILEADHAAGAVTFVPLDV